MEQKTCHGGQKVKYIRKLKYQMDTLSILG